MSTLRAERATGLDMLAERGARTSAVDFAPEMITLAKSRVRNVEFIEADCERLPFDTAQFDVATCCFGRAALRAVGRCVCGSRPCPQAWRAVCFHGMEKPCRRWSLPWFDSQGLDEKFAYLTVPLPPGPPLFELTDVTRTKARLMKLNFEGATLSMISMFNGLRRTQGELLI